MDLSGLFLTDDPSIAGQAKFAIAALSFIGPHGCLKWDADGDSSQGHQHTNFKLSAFGETLRLYGRDLELIDTVSFDAQEVGVTEGRLPTEPTPLSAFPTLLLQAKTIIGLCPPWQSAKYFSPRGFSVGRCH